MEPSLNDILTERFSYDPLTGVIRYKMDILRSKTRKGDIAGCLTSQGYLVINIGAKQLLLHRIAWFLYHGTWPNLIDHKNRNKSDNRLLNLRDASSNVNAHNKNTTNILKTKGVRMVPSGRYVASIKYKKKGIYLGTFDTLEEASEVYITKAKELFT